MMKPVHRIRWQLWKEIDT